MRTLRNGLLPLLLALFALPCVADNQLLMMRSPQSFPETMLALQNKISDYGYTLSRVQRVDIGLTESGFTTDKYRIVFFGKPEEVRSLSQAYPQLIPYLPLKMTLIAEQDETVLVTFDPWVLANVVQDEKVRYQLQRWRNDILAIYDELRE